MTRRIVVLSACLVSAALMSLAGCGNTPRVPGQDAREITLWNIQTNPATARVLAGAIGRFEIAHPGVIVKPAVVENDQYKPKFRRATATKSLPDVFHTWGGGQLAEIVRLNQVKDLTDAAAADNITKRIMPAALDIATVDGRLYAVPMDVSVVVMWYHKSLFAKAGIEPPQTWEELKSACAKLQKTGVTPIALGNKDKWPGAFYFSYLAVRLGGTKPFADAASRAGGPGAPGFEHPSFIEAGRMLQDFAKAGYFTKGADALGYDEARSMFLSGNAGMMLMGTWLLADVKPELLADIDCFAFPEVPGGKGDPKIVVGGINSAYAVSAAATYPRDAMALLKELTSDLTEQQWGETGRVPALRPELAEGMVSTAAYPAARLLYQAPQIQLYYDQALNSELSELHKDTTQSIIAGTQTPEVAAREMEQAATAR